MNAPAKITPDSRALSPAERLMDMAATDMAAVDAIILDRMHSPIGLIPDLAQHLVKAGGKRLRPLLTVATAQMCGYEGGSHHKLAAAVEFIHSATLLHDDVVDDSKLRRGKKPANLIWGNSSSILVGDFLFARAFNLMVETGSLDALDILSRASAVIAEGEVHQLSVLRRIDMTEATYIDVISAKTAALFAAATEVSPVIAERPAAEREALKAYGLNLGLAFQLVDDALDYGGFESALGKSVGDDFREGKVTLPVIYAMRNDDTEAQDFWKRVIVDNNQEDVDFERAVSLIRAAGALDATLDMARGYASKARSALMVFPESPWRLELQNLADYVVDRIS